MWNIKKTEFYLEGLLHAIGLIYITNKLHHRKCAVRIFIHKSQNFRNERVSVANEWVSKVLQRVNKIRTAHFLWSNLFLCHVVLSDRATLAADQNLQEADQELFSQIGTEFLARNELGLWDSC